MIRFREVKISDAAKILRWRTSPEVSNYMITDIDEDLKKIFISTRIHLLK